MASIALVPMASVELRVFHLTGGDGSKILAVAVSDVLVVTSSDWLEVRCIINNHGVGMMGR